MHFLHDISSSYIFKHLSELYEFPIIIVRAIKTQKNILIYLFFNNNV